MREYAPRYSLIIVGKSDLDWLDIRIDLVNHFFSASKSKPSR